MTIEKNQRALAQLSALYRPGTLNLIGGRPGMGKTTMAFHLATEAHLPTAYFSLDMKRDQLLLRHSTGQCPKWIHLDDTATLTVDSIREKVHQLREIYDIRWVIIDYLQLMTSSQPYPNREDEIIHIIQELKKMAVEQHVAVIAPTQLLRTVLMHDDYRPTLQDMPNWERIGEWVDDVRLLHRDEYYHIVGGKRDLMEVLATECGQSNLPDLQLSCLMWEISFTMMRDYEDPKLFPMEEDAFYGSHWNEMLWAVSSLSRMDAHTIHNGESNKLDDGQTWAEGPLRIPQFEHICVCYLVHALCTHLRYSIPDLLRMTTYSCERSMWEMSEADVD